MKNEDFLDDGAKTRLSATDEERISYIQRDRFLPHREIERLWDMMSGFVERPRTLRPPCLAIVGDAGAGKTSLLLNFRKSMEERDQTSVTRTCVAFSAPANAAIGVLQSSLLAALGIPRFSSTTQHRQDADRVIHDALIDAGVKILLIDEIQHLECKTNQSLRVSWDWIKSLSTEGRVSVVCAGIRGYQRHLHREEQLQTRFQIVELPRWQPGPALEEFLVGFERTLPLRKSSKLGRFEMQKCIIEETVALESIPGITGGVKRVVEYAAIHAIRTGEERITASSISAWRGGLRA